MAKEQPEKGIEEQLDIKKEIKWNGWQIVYMV